MMHVSESVFSFYSCFSAFRCNFPVFSGSIYMFKIPKSHFFVNTIVILFIFPLHFPHFAQKNQPIFLHILLLNATITDAIIQALCRMYILSAEFLSIFERIPSTLPERAFFLSSSGLILSLAAAKAIIFSSCCFVKIFTSKNFYYAFYQIFFYISIVFLNF